MSSNFSNKGGRDIFCATHRATNVRASVFDLGWLAIRPAVPLQLRDSCRDLMLSGLVRLTSVVHCLAVSVIAFGQSFSGSVSELIVLQAGFWRRTMSAKISARQIFTTMTGQVCAHRFFF